MKLINFCEEYVSMLFRTLHENDLNLLSSFNFNFCKFMSRYLYLANNLKDIQDNTEPYISCKTFFQHKVTVFKENINLL